MSTATSSLPATWRSKLARCSATSAVRSQPQVLGLKQVTKITIFVVGYRREQLPAIEEGRQALFGDHKPADTLVGVETLSRPEYLIEVEAVAVIDG